MGLIKGFLWKEGGCAGSGNKNLVEAKYSEAASYCMLLFHQLEAVCGYCCKSLCLDCSFSMSMAGGTTNGAREMEMGEGIREGGGLRYAANDRHRPGTLSRAGAVYIED